MKKLAAIILIIISLSSPIHAKESYDPQHTMLALNMAIVSIHRIISTQDRIILDQEYNTIINKLALGNNELHHGQRITAGRSEKVSGTLQSQGTSTARERSLRDQGIRRKFVELAGESRNVLRVVIFQLPVIKSRTP